MIYTSKKLSPVRAISEHCGTGACMNVLNYFWGTTFDLKDTLDIETMIRFGHFEWNERPAETDIIYFLAQMGFKIEVFSRDIGDWSIYLSDPKLHQEKHGYTSHPLVDTELGLLTAKKLAMHPNYILVEDSSLNIASVIKSMSDWKHMFLFGLDRNVIDRTESTDNSVNWHIMSSMGYTSLESDKIWLIETSPAAEIIERTYEEIQAAQEFLSPQYKGPKGEIIVISLMNS